MGMSCRKHRSRLLAPCALLALACLCPTARAQQRTIRFKGTSPRDLKLAEALRVRVTLEYEVPTELSEIVDFMNAMIARKVGLRGALRLDPKAIELNPRHVQLTMENVRVARALRLLLTDATTADEERTDNALSFVHWSDAGVIYITHRRRLRRLSARRKTFRFVDVRDLLAAYPVGPGGGAEGDDDDDDDGDFFDDADDDDTGGRGGGIHGMNELMRTIVRLTGRANWGDVDTDEGDDE